ncbi:MAG TPA: S-methyl-5'-thioadenosine phosphorylase [Candidatus Omnitrophica bacterium]|nr:MAG: methylthioadenosine phosphorylase [Omnitrophica WOR_2 bacterium GWA2_53_43]HBO96866.1 S-methyl-5'-thioadenosine phosphorylase [Candidatus Omnitrophota bacterium]HCI44679.1 S-methyl-5'-thioadenosine phosphorylase [Candidatus Omnitrophota bacterium]
MAKVGIIGGSGLYKMEGLEQVEDLTIIDTPFGPPSDHFLTGKVDGTDVVFLSRHGRGHHISPGEINYRANIFELKRLGVDAIISVSACGSMKEEIKPMDFVVPDQFIDRTNSGRAATFFTGGIVAHVSMAEPVSPELTGVLIGCCRELGATVHSKGTYVNMEGPQFSTKAESNLYRSWGVDIIGMTNMVEAKLAREAEIAYASLCAVTDYDCWHSGHDSVTVDMIISYLNKNIETARKIIGLAVPRIGKITQFTAQDALKHAIMTDPAQIPEQKKRELQIIVGKYIK